MTHPPLPVSIPAETTNQTLVLMKLARCWLLWRSERDEEGKLRKVPYYAVPNYAKTRKRQGTLDSPEDRAQLVNYDEAVAAFNSAPQGFYDGLGFALGPDGSGYYWQGIDLDNIIANGLGSIANEWSVGAYSDWCYSELSPSEKGMHIIGYGRPFPRNLDGGNGTGIEAYFSKRYFTFTGHELLPHGGVKRGLLGDLYDYAEQVLRPRWEAGKISRNSYAGRAEMEIDDETYADLRSALIFWDPNNRGEWIRVVAALKDLGQRGLDLWIMSYSVRSEKFDEKEAMRVWNSFKPDGTTNYKNIFKVAQERTWLNPQSAASLRRRYCKCGATVILPPLRYDFRTGEVTPGKLGGLPNNLWPQTEHVTGSGPAKRQE